MPMHCHYSTQDGHPRPRCVPYGPFGGTTGDFFVEIPENCYATIKSVTVYTFDVILGIQLTYRLSDGSEYVGALHGVAQGHKCAFNVPITVGVRVINVSGLYDLSMVGQLTFVSSYGFSWTCGSGGDAWFGFPRCEVRGIFGYAWNTLSSIGFLCN